MAQQHPQRTVNYVLIRYYNSIKIGRQDRVLPALLIDASILTRDTLVSIHLVNRHPRLRRSMIPLHRYLGSRSCY